MSELGNDLPIMRSIICQLVAYNLTDITVKGSWIGPGRLHLIPHVNAPVADLPVRRVLGADHFIADLTLPYGRIARLSAARSAERSPATPFVLCPSHPR